MQSARTDVADGQSGRLEQLPLNIQIPLIHFRRDIRVIVHTNELRRRRQCAWEWIRELRQRNEGERVRRIEVIAGRVASSANRIVEDSDAGTDRCLVIAKRIVSESDSGIPIPGCGIGCENVGNALERSERRILHRVQRVHVRRGIRHKFVADTHVKRQLRKRLPLIVDVEIKFAFTEITIRIRLTRLWSLEEAWNALQEIRQTRKRIEATP